MRERKRAMLMKWIQYILRESSAPGNDAEGGGG